MIIIQIFKTIAGVLVVLIFTGLGIWLASLLMDPADRIESALNELGGCLGELLLIPIGVFFWLLVPVAALTPTMIGWTLATDLLHLLPW